MARLIGIIVGLGFVGVAFWSLLWGVIAYVSTEHHEDAAHAIHQEPRDIAFSTDGPFGHFDRQQLQRGFQVYREVCASCHGLGYVAFRNLADLGYNEAEIEAIAAQWPIQVPDVDPNTGDARGRPARASDTFPSPYANEVAARAANNNAMPPDLSLIVKARHGGAAYVTSLLTGYRNVDRYRTADGHPVPRDLRPGQGLHFNPWFPNLNLAMPPPLTADGQVTYAPGNPPATVEQMAQDVSAFLTWTAEPNLESRHRAGLATLIFLLIGTILAYLAYQNVWRSAKQGVRITGPLDPENMAKSEAAKRDAGIAG
jgi:ubiquinol-cytochrome c reductase cytochrome c1 subunit